MILINKHNISAVLPAISNEESRYTMRAIHITEQFTEATDGHRAIRVSNPADADPKDFPCVPGFTPNGFKEGLLSLDAAKQLVKAFPKRCGHMPILNHAAVTTHDDKLQLAVTDLDNPQVFNPRPITGNFPDVQRVVDDAKAKCTTFEITLGPEYLADMALAAHKFGATTITLKFADATSAVLMEAENPDHQQWTGVLMPRRK
jgi:DNA polymerase III sliding clamp (beta) subunit (PCNA family)